MTIQSYQIVQRERDEKARVFLKNGQILELPVGGPYKVDDAHDVFVGDIWILAGQSNMEGVGDLVDVESPSPFVHSHQSREQWAIAEEPLHWLNESPYLIQHKLLYGRDVVPGTQAPRDPHRLKGAGLGVSFGKELYSLTNVPIGLIPCAHGGTSLEQWNPSLRNEGGGSLYGATLQRVRHAGGKVAGVLWYQGESETNMESVISYPERMTALVNAFRADLEQPDLPFYFVQIGRVVNAEAQGWMFHEESWNSIRESQRVWGATMPNTAIVTAIDLELDDLIHVGTQGLKRLGKRLARVVAGQRSPDISAVQIEADGCCIRVLFRNVQGSLQASGRPAGFSLRDGKDVELPIIYKVTLEGDSALLHLTVNALPEDTTVCYGQGLDPYCNITDTSDLALPAFGPIPLTTLTGEQL